MFPSFFDIPVYRITRENYYADREEHIRRMLYKTENLRRFYAEFPDQERMMREHLSKGYGGAWEFNEIMGFIRLHFLGTQIRGEWWRIDAKRITRTRTKRFEFRDWKVVHEDEIPTDSTNNEIYGVISKYLKRAQEDKHLKRFHIDTSVFERTGPFVDWNALLKKSNERSQSSDTVAASP